jgi:hypothetical protein
MPMRLIILMSSDWWRNMHHRAKLTDEQVREIRKAHLAYVIGYETLAKLFNCGVSTIRDICTYRTRVNT